MSGKKNSPRLYPVSSKVWLILSIGFTSIKSPHCRFRLSAGVALFGPRAYSPRSFRRVRQKEPSSNALRHSEDAAIAHKHFRQAPFESLPL